MPALPALRSLPTQGTGCATFRRWRCATSRPWAAALTGGAGGFLPAAGEHSARLHAVPKQAPDSFQPVSCAHLLPAPLPASITAASSPPTSTLTTTPLCAGSLSCCTSRCAPMPPRQRHRRLQAAVSVACLLCNARCSPGQVTRPAPCGAAPHTQSPTPGAGQDCEGQAVRRVLAPGWPGEELRACPL